MTVTCSSGDARSTPGPATTPNGRTVASNRPAIIVAWGVDETCEQQQHLPGDDAASLTADYEWITGKQPICGTDMA